MASVKSLLRKSRRLMSRSLVVSDLLLLDLHDIDFIKDSIDDINRQTPADMRVTIIMEILSKVPENISTAVIDAFLAALREDGQEHVANIFSHQSDARPMSDEHYQLLIDKKDQISFFLDPHNGVLDHLQKSRVLTIKEIEYLTNITDRAALVDKLVIILSRKADSAFDFVITALRNTGQQHIATILLPELGISPMSDECRQHLQNKKTEISMFLDPLNGVLDELVCCGVFSQRDSGQVRAHRGLDEMARETIDILSRKADSAFDLFIAALHNTGQGHVAAILRPDTSTVPLSDQHRQMLTSKQALITKYFYVDRSITADLSSIGVLSSREEEIVNSMIGKGSHEMARQIVYILLRKPDSVYETFCQFLDQTSQEHVLYVLTGKGKPPLSRMRSKVIAQMRDKLVRQIDMESSFRLTGILASRGSISDSNKQTIEAQLTCERRCEILLDIITCKSNSSYDIFLQALNETGQQHLSTALNGLEVKAFVETYFRNDLPDDVRNMITDCIQQNMNRFCDVVESDIQAALLDVMESNGFVMSEVGAGSIIVTFRCYGFHSFLDFTRLIVSKKLDEIFTKTFCPPFAEHGLERLQFHITEKELHHCAEQFQRTKLMSEFHADVLDHVAEQFCGTFIVTRKLLNCLSLSDDQKDAILASSQMTKALFKAVSRRPDVVFFQFVDVLKDFGHYQIAEYLLSNCRTISMLPVKLLQQVLVRTFITLFTDYRSIFCLEKREAIAAAYSALSAVCYDWWQTMNSSWPQSKTRHWLRHRLQHSVQSVIIHRLPLELLEHVLMKTFVRLFIEHESPFCLKRREAIAAAYNTLSAVCYYWWQTMNGWPQFKFTHQLDYKAGLRRLQNFVQSVCRPYSMYPRLHLSIAVPNVVNVAQCDSKLFVVCDKSETIQVYGLDNKYQTNIAVNGLKDPRDIVACTETKQLYISDHSSDCVWRVSSGGRRVVKWLTNKSASTTGFSPCSLSLTSRRLLVTSPAKNSLFLFKLTKVLLKRIVLLNIDEVQHAVETSHGTFIVSHFLPQPQISEVDANGQTIKSDLQQLGSPWYMALDSECRVLVADIDEHRVLLLNYRLELERVLLDTEHHQLAQYPWRLCYVEQTCQLIVSSDCIQVFNIHQPIQC